MIEILSLGAGVQSSCVLRMSIHGELPKLDHVIFADTGWEPAAVYEHLEVLKVEAKEAGIPLHVVQYQDIRIGALEAMDKTNFNPLPVFNKSPNGTKAGMTRRQCTREYKVAPIENFVRRSVLGIKPRCHAPKEPVVRQWIGISLDELQRAKPSRVPWKSHWFPLIDRKIRREGCQEWMEERGYGRAPRSACIGCPYKDNREWGDMRQAVKAEWTDACEFDERLRDNHDPKGEMYLHRSLVPLSEVDLDPDRDQLRFWDDECEGLCGV